MQIPLLSKCMYVFVVIFSSSTVFIFSFLSANSMMIFITMSIVRIRITESGRGADRVMEAIRSMISAILHERAWNRSLLLFAIICRLFFMSSSKSFGVEFLLEITATVSLFAFNASMIRFLSRLFSSEKT